MQVIFSSFSLMGFSLQALAKSVLYTCMLVTLKKSAAEGVGFFYISLGIRFTRLPTQKTCIIHVDDSWKQVLKIIIGYWYTPF